MNLPQFFLLCLAGWIHRNQQHVIEYLQEEVKVLKEQLGNKPRFKDDQRRRLAAEAKKLGLEGLQRVATIATPRTLLAWHQRLIGRKYDGRAKRSPGRPSTPTEVRELILRMAAENRTWGYTRLQGALRNWGHQIGRRTIAKVLKEAGVDPAPGRKDGTTWKEFLRTHWEVLAAADFFKVEVWTALGLVRYHVFFVIRLPARSPNLNAFAERSVRSIRESCLDRPVLIGEASLQRATSQFLVHYHHERNHQSLENKLLRPEFTPPPDVGTIQRRSRLGGLLNYYYRHAA